MGLRNFEKIGWTCRKHIAIRKITYRYIGIRNTGTPAGKYWHPQAEVNTLDDGAEEMLAAVRPVSKSEMREGISGMPSMP